jgi:hypothetical protein
MDSPCSSTRCTCSRRRSRIPSRDGRLPEGFVPHGDGELAGDDGGAALHAVLDHLEHVGGLVGAEGTDQEVVDEQDVDAGPVGEETGEATFGAGHGDLVEQAGAAQVEVSIPPSDGHLI